MNRETVRELLQSKGSEKLFWHACRVEDTAFLLAGIYNFDQEKAALAGLTHDYGKLYGREEQIRLVQKNSINIDSIMLLEPVLLHAPVGAWLLEHELGLPDMEILEAVRLHTTGAAGMSLLSRIVYLADFIEPGRCFTGVQEVRDLALQHGQLEQALLLAVQITIYTVLQNGRLLHDASIALHNSLVLYLREKELEAKNGEG